MSAPKRVGLLVTRSFRSPAKVFTAVTVPPEAAELVNERSMKAPGIGCGVGVESSSAVTVTIVEVWGTSEPVAAIGVWLKTSPATGENT